MGVCVGKNETEARVGTPRYLTPQSVRQTEGKLLLKADIVRKILIKKSRWKAYRMKQM